MRFNVEPADGQVIEICGIEMEPQHALVLVNEEGGEGLWILQHLVRNGAVVIELDDGPHDGFEVLKQLDGEYWDYAVTERGRHVFVMHGKFRARS